MKGVTRLNTVLKSLKNLKTFCNFVLRVGANQKLKENVGRMLQALCRLVLLQFIVFPFKENLGAVVNKGQADFALLEQLLGLPIGSLKSGSVPDHEDFDTFAVGFQRVHHVALVVKALDRSVRPDNCNEEHLQTWYQNWKTLPTSKKVQNVPDKKKQEPPNKVPGGGKPKEDHSVVPGQSEISPSVGYGSGISKNQSKPNLGKVPLVGAGLKKESLQLLNTPLKPPLGASAGGGCLDSFSESVPVDVEAAAADAARDAVLDRATLRQVNLVHDVNDLGKRMDSVRFHIESMMLPFFEVSSFFVLWCGIGSKLLIVFSFCLCSPC